MIKSRALLLAALLTAGCGNKKHSNASEPVTCEVAGKMEAKRLGEFADRAQISGDRRTKLDADLATAVTKRCNEDKWDEVTLGCLGAVATIKEGEVPVDKYNSAIDTCTKAIGEDKLEKMDSDVAKTVRASK
jgi:hypothetical protein